MSPAYSPTLRDENARQSDPDTSKAAAKEDRTGLEQSVLDGIRLDGHRGCTTDDVWHRLVNDCGLSVRPNSVARRITSLAKAGRVELAGQRPGDSGRQQNVWRTPSYLANGAA